MNPPSEVDNCEGEKMEELTADQREKLMMEVLDLCLDKFEGASVNSFTIDCSEDMVSMRFSTNKGFKTCGLECGLMKHIHGRRNYGDG